MTRPGSTLWLMAHEMRLVWRLGGDKARWARLVLFAILLALIGAAAGPIGYVLRGRSPSPDGLAVLICAGLFGFIAIMSFSVALSAIAASFIDRGDLDLLLSSPLPMRRVLTVRLAAVAIRSVALWLALFGPPVVVVAAIAGPRWLGGLVLLLSGGLAGTSLASWLAVGLFRLLGPRRVKTVTTLVSALSGISVGMMSPFIGRGLGARQVSGGLPGLPADGLLGLPARAVYGDPLAGFEMIAFMLAVFLVTTWLLAPTFSRISLRVEAHRRPSAGQAPLRGFGGGLFRLLLIKDYRLLLRNHALLLQSLSRGIAFIPVLVINLSQAGRSTTPAQIALAATLVLGQVSGALVWAFMFAESQPDLMASAPIRPGLALRSRLTAALVPALTLVLLAAGFTAMQDRLAGLAILTMATGACLCSAAINVTAKASPVRRGAWGGALRPTIAAMLTDMIGSGFWCGAAYLLATGSIWTALPVWLALSTVWLWREITRKPATFD
jgi:ABC-2 type transport system permease protein